MTRFFTSDLHFDHAKIVGYCSRPFDSVFHMNAELIARWNARVGDRDQVWVLGDFAFANKRRVSELLSTLRGRKFLVRGNHDPLTTVAAEGWEDTFDSTYLALGSDVVEMTHDPARAPGRVPLVLHGHMHGTRDLHDFEPSPGLRYLDVGVDAGWGWAPASEEEVVAKLKETRS